MKSTGPVKGLILFFLIMATPCYGANSTKISHSTTDFYILKHQPFTTISCTIQPDAAIEYLASLEEKPEDITINYTIEENFSDYSFVLSHEGKFEFSPTELQLHLDEKETQESNEDPTLATTHAWKKRVETGYKDLIGFSSQLVADGFTILTPSTPEGKIISTQEKSNTLTFIYGSLFSKTILRYKASEKGYLLIESSISHSNFNEKLSSDQFSIDYQTINNLLIPKKISRTLYANKSINGKKNNAQAMVVELKECLVEN